MEIVRKPTFIKHSESLGSASRPAGDPSFPQPPSVEQLNSYSRGYLTGRHDGALAGLCLGAFAGVVVAVLVSSLV